MLLMLLELHVAAAYHMPAVAAADTDADAMPHAAAAAMPCRLLMIADTLTRICRARECASASAARSDYAMMLIRNYAFLLCLIISLC